MKLPIFIPLSAGLLFTSNLLTAASFVWTGAGIPLGNRNWTNTNNWNTGTVPPKNLNTDITIAVGGTIDPLVNEAWTLNSLTFNGGYYLEGEAITLGSGGLTAINSATITNPLKIVRDQTWLGRITCEDAVHFLDPIFPVTNPFVLSVAGDVNLSGGLSGTGDLDVTSDHSLRFYAAGGVPFYAPGVRLSLEQGSEATISKDTAVSISSLQGQGAMNFFSAGSELTLLTSASRNFDGRFGVVPEDRFTGPTSPGNLKKMGAGILTLRGGGVVDSAQASALNLLNVDQGTVKLDNATLLTMKDLTGTGNLVIEADSRLSIQGGRTSIFDGLIQGGGILSLVGNSTLDLRASAELHEIGTLRIASGSQVDFGNTASILTTGNLDGTGTLRFTGEDSALSLTGSDYFAGTLQNTGTVAAPLGSLRLGGSYLNLASRTANHAFKSIILDSQSLLLSGNLSVQNVIGDGGIELHEAGSLTFNHGATNVFPATISYVLPTDAMESSSVTLTGAGPLRLESPSKSHQMMRLNLGTTGLRLGGNSNLNLGQLSGNSALRIDTGSNLTITDYGAANFTGTLQNGLSGGGEIDLTSSGTRFLRAGAFTGKITIKGSGAAILQSPPGAAPAGHLVIGTNAKLECTDINNLIVENRGHLAMLSVPSPQGPVHGGCITGSYTQTASAPNSTILNLSVNDRPTRPTGYGRVRTTGNIVLGTGRLELEFNNTFNAQVGDVWPIFQSSGGTLTKSSSYQFVINASNLPIGSALVWEQTSMALNLKLVSTDPSTDPPGYFTWATAEGLTEGNRSPSLDPDQDGIPNWQEYLLILKPGLPSRLPVDAVEIETEFNASVGPVFVFKASESIVFENEFEVQGSSDLGESDPWDVTKAVATIVSGPSNGFYQYSYRFHQSPEVAPKGFLRIRYKGFVSVPIDPNDH